MFRNSRQWHRFMCALAIPVLCISCSSQDKSVENTIDLVVNIEKYTKFLDFYEKFPNLKKNIFDPYTLETEREGKKSYLFHKSQNPSETLQVSLHMTFIDDELIEGTVGGLGPEQLVEDFEKQILRGLNVKGKYVDSYITKLGNGSTYPVIVLKDDSYSYYLRFESSEKGSGNEGMYPGILIGICKINGSTFDKVPAIETTIDEKRAIFERSGVSKILEELNIDLDMK